MIDNLHMRESDRESITILKLQQKLSHWFYSFLTLSTKIRALRTYVRRKYTMRVCVTSSIAGTNYSGFCSSLGFASLCTFWLQGGRTDNEKSWGEFKIYAGKISMTTVSWQLFSTFTASWCVTPSNEMLFTVTIWKNARIINVHSKHSHNL